MLNNVQCDGGQICVDYVGRYNCECPPWKIGSNCSEGELEKVC